MRLAPLLTVAVVAQALLGHICLMPMASAQEAAVDHHAGNEAVMGAEAEGHDPAPACLCGDCADEIDRRDHDVLIGQMPSDGDHCLSESASQVMIITQKSQFEVPSSAAVPIFDIAIDVSASRGPAVHSVLRDERLPFSQTTVLRE